MSAQDAMAESLNYPSTKMRAVASRSYRVKISPVNGQKFEAGQTVNIDMPSNLSGTYVNWNQCYLKFKVTTTGGVGMRLDRAGANSFINRVQCQTAGAQIFDLPNWNVLMTILTDADSSPAYKSGVGSVLMGTQGFLQAGEVLAAATARTYCVPFVLHPFGMSTPHRLMPLFSSAPVQFKLTLESIVNAIKSTTTPTKIEFDEVELVCVFTELSPGAQAQVDQMSGGIYNILASSYQNVGTTMAVDSTAVTANLGVSVSSLERVIVCHRPTASLNVATCYSLGHRIKNHLSQYSIFVNGEQYPARPVIVENKCAEALAEFLLSDHSLVNFDKQSSFNVAVNGVLANLKSNGLDGQSVNGVLEPYIVDAVTLGNSDGATDVSASNIGSFITAVEMETGLSDGRSQRLYSGISTISSTVNYRGVYEAGAVAAQIDFFCQNTVLLSLNSRGTNVWSISV